MTERRTDDEKTWGEAREMLVEAITSGRMNAVAWIEHTADGYPRYIYMGYADGRLALLAYLEKLSDPPSIVH